MAYFLRSGVYTCVADRHCVFLDLARDRYFSVKREHLQLLMPQIVGSFRRPANEPLSVEMQALATSLVAKGLLTLDRTEASGPNEGPRSGARPPSSSLMDDSASGTRVRARLSALFVAAATRAYVSLATRPLRSTVERVKRRRRRHQTRAAPFDFARAASVVRQFDVLRPWFPRNYLCLFDSLALLELLALYGLYPTWVFGVHPEPFEAHCWLQQNDVVLNDSMAHVETFVPIMVA
jgi:hypothetical protein